MSEKINIYMPHPKWGHKGDSFREIIMMWAERNYINLHMSPDRYVWWNSPGEVLLHDLPKVLDVVRELPNYRLGLFGNEIFEPDDKKNQRWIFWPRNPRLVDEFRKQASKHIRTPRYRYVHSLFAGKIENEEQARNRFQSRIDWTKHIEECKIVKGVDAKYPYTPNEYVLLMAKTKYALCLPGYGPKCNRDIEAIALGCIPVFTPGCCFSYYNHLTEGDNLLIIRSEDEIEKILNTDDDVLEKIQHNNNIWYEENCSIDGAFKTTKAIIERHL